MNFQQLRSVREAIRCGFNLTEVAKVLHTSQPGVSRQIRELEEELGVDLFVRAGKRLTSLTEVGALIVPIVENMLNDAENLKRAGEEFSQQATGRLSIATTHSQARYALPGAVRDFRQRFPQVSFNLHQGTPDHVAQMLISGEADIGIATEALTKYDSLVALPCFRWTHSVIVPPGHALLYLMGMILAERMSARLAAAVPLLAAPAILWLAWSGQDSLSLGLYGLFLMFMIFGTDRKSVV